MQYDQHQHYGKSKIGSDNNINKVSLYPDHSNLAADAQPFMEVPSVNEDDEYGYKGVKH